MSEYEKLQMTANKDEGGFVKNLKGQTGTGFAAGTHVHKDWYAKTQSYDSIMGRFAQTRSDFQHHLLTVYYT